MYDMSLSPEFRSTQLQYSPPARQGTKIGSSKKQSLRSCELSRDPLGACRPYSRGQGCTMMTVGHCWGLCCQHGVVRGGLPEQEVANAQRCTVVWGTLEILDWRGGEARTQNLECWDEEPRLDPRAVGNQGTFRKGRDG